MRGPRSRPTSQQSAQPYLLVPPTRKVFNCIVDDTALVAGVKKSTRNGIRQWVKNGQIRLFVPLHALDQLSRQKGSSNRHGEDVRETLQWLDEATSKHPHAVTLQGGDQYYQRWTEVERFAVPRTLFSEDDHVGDIDMEPEADGLTEDTINKLTLSEGNRKTPLSSAASNMSGTRSPSSMVSMGSSISPVSPPTSPTKGSSPVKQFTALTQAHAHESSSSATVPVRLQPLFNYILWRVHQELDPIAALESFIFLCNDPNKVNYAKGFDIRYKRLEQLREAIGREDRDFRNRRMLQNRENQSAAASGENIAMVTATATTPQDEDDDEDDEVVFKPPPRAPAAMIPKLSANVMDPNAFSRNTTTCPTSEQAPSPAQPQSPRQQSVQSQAQQGRAGTAYSPRGTGRCSNRGPARGGGGRGTANVGAGPGRAGFAPSTCVVNVTNPTQPNGQIDPDSFTRPRGSGYTGRGGRKLWVPT